MNRPSLFLGVALALSALTSAHAQTAPAPEAKSEITAASALDEVLAGSWRDPANAARDGYRHPKETLSFFGLSPAQTVIEITPGGGWYSEILAPYLRDGGQYIAAVVDPASVAEGKSRDYQQKNKTTLETKFGAAAAQYAKAKIVGDIEYRTLEMHLGAVVQGKLHYAEPGTASVVELKRVAGE